MSTHAHAVVIGAGLGGLAAAVRLLEQGYRVTVLERREGLGGRAYQLADGGYTFDMGPSLITMPWLLDELYALAGTSRRGAAAAATPRPVLPHPLGGRPAHVRLQRLPRADEGGGGPLLPGGRRALRRVHGALEGDPRAGHPGRRAEAVPGAVEFAKLVPTMVRLGAIRSLAGSSAAHFHEPHVRQAFDFHSLFIGGDPCRVPAIYTALSYLQVADGVWYADGGVHSVVRVAGRAHPRGRRDDLHRRARWRRSRRGSSRDRRAPRLGRTIRPTWWSPTRMRR